MSKNETSRYPNPFAKTSHEKTQLSEARLAYRASMRREISGWTAKSDHYKNKSVATAI